LELESWLLPRFPTYFFPSGVFSGRFFLASVQTAFALLTVAQLYQFFLKTFVRFLLVFLYFRFILHCTSELMIPSLTGSLTGTKLESLYGDVGQDGLIIL